MSAGLLAGSDLEGCVDSARVIDENFNVVMGMAFSAYYMPYQSLALIGLLPKMAGGARLTAMRTIRRNQRRLDLGCLIAGHGMEIPMEKFIHW